MALHSNIKNTVITLSITERNFQQIEGDLSHLAGRLFLGMGAITSAKLVSVKGNKGLSIRWRRSHIERLLKSSALLWPNVFLLDASILELCFDHILKKINEDLTRSTDCALRFLLTRNEEEEEGYLLLAQRRPIKNKKDILLLDSAQDRWCRFPSFLKAGFYIQDLELQKIAQNKFDKYNVELFWSFTIGNKKYIEECTGSNIFIFDGNKFKTPALKPGILAGVTRKKLIDFFIKNHIPFEERDIELEELKNSQSIWLSNAVLGVRAVSLYDGKNYKKDNEYMKSFCDEEID